MFPPPLKIVFISGSSGIWILVNEEELKTPAISIIYCKLILSYPLKNDFKLRVVPNGDPGGSVILTFSNEEILNGKYD